MHLRWIIRSIIGFIFESPINFIVILNNIQFLLFLITAQICLWYIFIIHYMVELIFISQFYLYSHYILQFLFARIKPCVWIVQIDKIDKDVFVYFVLLGKIEFYFGKGIDFISSPLLHSLLLLFFILVFVLFIRGIYLHDNFIQYPRQYFEFIFLVNYQSVKNSLFL